MVKITETPDGLELRSTSWIKIEEKMKELTVQKYNDLGGKMFPVIEYEFIEDHIEIKDLPGDWSYEAVNDKVTALAPPRLIEYVITLKKLKP